MAFPRKWCRLFQHLNPRPGLIARPHWQPAFQRFDALQGHRPMSTAGAQISPGQDGLIEEAALPHYDHKEYYPVRLGEVLGGQYKIISKLGYGRSSTVWLCKNQAPAEPAGEYVALKAYVNSLPFNRELEAYLHLDSIAGREYQGGVSLRRAYDYFEVEGPHGKHMCLVQEALGPSLSDILLSILRGPLEPLGVRYIAGKVLETLKYLHTEAEIVHTDITPRNVLLGVEDKSVFQRVEQAEIDEPTVGEEADDHVVYRSRLVKEITGSCPVLCDLTEAVFGGDAYSGPIMCDPYRAPELILDMTWKYPVDIWSLGMMVWNLLEWTNLITKVDDGGRYSEEAHLCRIAEVIGLPSPDFVKRSEKLQNFFDSEGQWKGSAPLGPGALDTRVEHLAGEEKAAFLRFMRKMLRWDPDERAVAEELLKDEWLRWEEA